MTHLLFDRLHAAAPARALVVTAPATTRLDLDDLQGQRRFNSLTAFGATKMANLLFTYALAREWQGAGIAANAVYTGLLMSGLLRNAIAPVRWISQVAAAPPEKAAEALAGLALSPEFAGANGRLFAFHTPIASNAYSHDPELQRRLWQASLALAGLA